MARVRANGARIPERRYANALKNYTGNREMESGRIFFCITPHWDSVDSSLKQLVYHRSNADPTAAVFLGQYNAC